MFTFITRVLFGGAKIRKVLGFVCWCSWAAAWTFLLVLVNVLYLFNCRNMQAMRVCMHKITAIFLGFSSGCQLHFLRIWHTFILFIKILYTTTTVLRPFVRNYLGEPVPAETLTHPPSWSSSNPCQLLPSTTIHSILPVQITCLAIFLHNLSPCPVWSTSWYGALHLIFHTLLHTVLQY